MPNLKTRLIIQLILTLIICNLFTKPLHADPFGSYPLNSAGWVVFCEPDKFKSAKNKETCENGADVKRFAENIYKSADLLIDRKLTHAKLRRVPLSVIESEVIPFSIFDEDNRSKESGEYFLMILLDDGTLKKSGSKLKTDARYNQDTGGIFITTSARYESALHELFHAVQNHYMPGFLKEEWISESTATAIKTWMPGSNLPRGNEYLIRLPRDWKHNVNKQSGAYPYLFSGFWHSIDESLSFMPSLIKGLGKRKATSNSTSVVSSVMEEIGLDDLPSQYDKMISVIVDSKKYPHCEGQKAIKCKDGNCSISRFLNESPMTTTCKALKIDKKSLGKCDLGDAEIEFKGDPDSHIFYIDQEMYLPGSKKTGLDNSFKIFSTVASISKSDIKPEATISCGSAMDIIDISISTGLGSGLHVTVDNDDKWEYSSSLKSKKPDNFAAVTYFGSSTKAPPGATGSQEITVDFSYLNSKDEKNKGKNVKGITINIDHKSDMKSQDALVASYGSSIFITFSSKSTVRLELEWNCEGKSMVTPSTVMSDSLYSIEFLYKSTEKLIECSDTNTFAKTFEKGKHTFEIDNIGLSTFQYNENKTDGIYATPASLSFNLKLK